MWKLAHAFFIIMGGFYFYGESGPRHPLSPANVIELVSRGHLVPPSPEELANQSKGDALSKAVAIVQALWFVTQCIARRVERLPMTNLEVMTLAYTAITVAMYAVWWYKPLNIGCAVRVPEETMKEEPVQKYGSTAGRIIAYVMGCQDKYVDLTDELHPRVPTFWAGCRGTDEYRADAIALWVAIVFGAIHCIAWTGTFPSHIEQQLWRASALAITTVPAVIVVGSQLSRAFSDAHILFYIMIAVILVPLVLIYIVARLVLIIISITSLTMLPVAVYQTVRWTIHVPHI